MLGSWEGRIYGMFVYFGGYIDGCKGETLCGI